MVLAAAALLAAAGCTTKKEHEPQMKPEAVSEVKDPKKLTEQEWKERLTPEQFYVCRQKGTERAGSGRYLEHWEKGTYLCVACGAPLFESKTKYEACGWPSFYDALPGAVSTSPDGGALEAMCAKCDSHLGHIFNDGPPPTGKRY
jgi:peptide-methionine (R)-S-oxide reductase